MRPLSNPIEILLVEDNPGDVDLMREGFAESEVPHHITVAVDGEAALALMRAEPADRAGNVRPDLVILDLNLPRKDGREVLSEMKGDPHLRHIPVVIFSSSDADRDLLQSYELHANCFVTKSLDLEALLGSVRAIADFWLKHAILPPRRRVG